MCIRDRLNLFLNDMFVANFWYGKRKSINVKIIQSTHPLLTRRILDEDIRDLSRVPKKFRKFLQQVMVNVPMTKPLSSYRVKRFDAADDVICSIPVRAEFVANSSHLTYFAFVHDMVGYSKPYRTVERVLEYNTPKQRATTFYLPNDQVYSGPVHYHPSSGWMAGARHTRASHPSLTRVDHKNFKVHDYRVFKRLREAQNSIILSPSSESHRRVFSDLFLSRDKESAARGLFVFDCEEYLKRNARYGRLLEMPGAYSRIPPMKIQELKIIRKRVEEGSTGDYDFKDQGEQYDLVAVSGDAPNAARLIKNSRYIDLNKDGELDTLVGTVREDKIFNLGNRRAFSFYDSFIKSFESGVYSYGVEMSIKDPTIDYLDLEVERLRLAHEHLSEYYRFVSNYAIMTSDGKISFSFLETIRKRYNISSKIGETTNDVPWRKSVRTYFNVLQNLCGFSSKQASNTLLQLMAPVSRDLRGVEMFLSIMEDLILKLTKDRVTAKNNEKKGTRHGGKKERTILDLKNDFDKSFSADTLKEYGFDFYGDYLNYNTEGLASIGIQSLRDRFELESKITGARVPKTMQGEEALAFYSRMSPLGADLSSNSFKFHNQSELEKH